MNNPIIVALDVPNAEEARNLVRKIGDAAGFFKVGMELYSSARSQFLEELVGGGHHVFLDLKFYDIPETVRRAATQVALRGVELLTIHGSQAIMEAAVKGRGARPLKLLGVTVLTSFDQTDMNDLGFSCSVEDLVTLRVMKAKESGMDGIVCSPLEAAKVRAVMGPDALVVTPGVRSPGVDLGDQKRVATPVEALRDGASHIVVGRQITRAEDPRAAAMRILEEIAKG